METKFIVKQKRVFRNLAGEIRRVIKPVCDEDGSVRLFSAREAQEYVMEQYNSDVMLAPTEIYRPSYTVSIFRKKFDRQISFPLNDNQNTE